MNEQWNPKCHSGRTHEFAPMSIKLLQTWERSQKERECEAIGEQIKPATGAAAMATKAVFTVVALLLAALLGAKAHMEPTKPESFSFKIILHNLASRDVTFRLANLGTHAYDVMVGKGEQWSAIGPLKVDLKYPVMRLIVSVHNKSYVLRKKTLELDLARRFGKGLKGKKFLVLTAVESWKQNFLFIKLGGEIVRRIKL